MKIVKIKRKQKRDLFVFPGWSFDHKIFSDQKWAYNILGYDILDLKQMHAVFERFIHDYRGTELYLAGWSMGAAILNEFLDIIIKFNKAAIIKKIFLISTARQFKETGVQEFITNLQEDYLNEIQHFYRRVFLGDKEKLKFFMEKYFQYYIDKNSVQMLLDELEFLKNYKLNLKLLDLFPVLLICSERDVITKLEHMKKIKDRLKNCSLLINGYTHAPFLYQQVIDEINKG